MFIFKNELKYRKPESGIFLHDYQPQGAENNNNQERQHMLRQEKDEERYYQAYSNKHNRKKKFKETETLEKFEPRLDIFRNQIQT
jgi:hypothetical protein